MPRPPANIIVPLRLSAATAAKLAAMLKRIGYTRLSAISRLVEWYAAQPEDIRSAIIGFTADHRKSARLIVRRMLKEAKGRS